MDPAVRLLLAHVSKLHGRTVVLEERTRALEKKVAWLEHSRDKWRAKALGRQQLLATHRRRAREQWTRAETWKHRAMQRVS
jgi:hypothetical protein